MGRDHIADRIGAVVWIALGLAMIWGGWAMDRLEVFRIQSVSIPGLVPMLVGGVLALCGVGLWFEKAATDTSAGDSAEMPEPPAAGLRRLWLSIALCLIYAMGLVGRLDFTLATFLFIAAFKLVFTAPPTFRAKPLPTLATALGFAAAAAFGISLLFEGGFLVRLP